MPQRVMVYNKYCKKITKLIAMISDEKMGKENLANLGQKNILFTLTGLKEKIKVFVLIFML